MKVSTSPVTFLTNDALDPADLNTLYQYASDAVDDVSQKRFQDSLLVLQYVEDVSSAYSNSSSTEELTYRFTCPNTCMVKASFLHANLVSTAEVRVTITTAAGASVPGAAVPLLTTSGAIPVVTVDTVNSSSDRFLLTAGVTYLFTVSSTGSFTLNRFDVILQLAVDRFTPTGTPIAPAFNPTLFTATNAPDATVVAANNTALSTASAVFAANVVAPTPLLFVRHNVVTSSTISPRTYSIPRYFNGRAQARITRIYLYAAMDATTGSTVSATLKDNGGSTLATVSANMSGISQITADSGALNIPIVSATSTVSTTVTLDYSLVLANASATNCRKLYALVWISR